MKKKTVNEAASQQTSTRLMRVNRFLAKKQLLIPLAAGGGIFAFFLLNYLINLTGNIITNLGTAIRGEQELKSYGPVLAFHFSLPWYVYLFLAITLSVVILYQCYKIRTSFKSYNVGQKGNERWATLEEIKEQYKAVSKAGAFYPGKGGVPIAEYQDTVFIDDSPINNLVIGMTRSGKGEKFVFPTIDIYSRAEEIKDRPSLIITDPKLELAASCYGTLLERGYEIHIMNLVEPERSMGFNPLSAITKAYQAGNYSEAELLCNAFCYTVFSPTPDKGENQFWDNNSVNALSALILAHVDDCLRLDEKENLERELTFKVKRKRFEQLGKRAKSIVLKHWDTPFAELYDFFGSEPKTVKQKAAQKLPEELKVLIEESGGKNNASYSTLLAHPEDAFQRTYTHEKEINMYSILHTFTYLAQQYVDERATALDLYFRSRPPLDRAAMKYAAVEVAGDRTKGSIFSNTLSQLTIFTYENIAKMTAESTLDLETVGFGEKPVAVFIGIPDFDKSNHFLASVFIRQLYFTLAKRATLMPGGRCSREVVFLLDEFGNLPPIENMANIITVCLSRNIRFNLIIQAYSQLEALYGKDAETISENCGNHIYILSNDQTTAERFSKKLGSETVTNVSVSGGKLGIDKNFSETYEEKPLLNPNQLLHLGVREWVVSRTMKREDLNGNPITPYPIYCTGDMSVSYRYEYLLPWFPSGLMISDYAPDGRELPESEWKDKILTIRQTSPIEDRSHISLEEWVFPIEESYKRLPYVIATMKKNVKDYIPPVPLFPLLEGPIQQISLDSGGVLYNDISQFMKHYSIPIVLSNFTSLYDLLQNKKVQTEKLQKQLINLFVEGVSKCRSSPF